MKPVRLALLIVALFCFGLYIFYDGWRSSVSTGSRPNFLGIGLFFWVLSELSTAL